jgi:hypothetical protein
LNEHLKQDWGIWMDQNFPNPVNDYTNVTIHMDNTRNYREVILVLKTPEGMMLQKIPVALAQGSNQIRIIPAAGCKGLMLCSLVVDGIVVQTMKMVVI